MNGSPGPETRSPRRSTGQIALSVVFFFVGVVLLLPGLCTLGVILFMAIWVRSGAFLGESSMFGIFLLSFLVAAVGAALIYLAVRGNAARPRR